MKIMVVPTWLPLQPTVIRGLAKKHSTLKLTTAQLLRPTADTVHRALQDYGLYKTVANEFGAGINYSRHDFLVFEDRIEVAENALENQTDLNYQIKNTWVAPGLNYGRGQETSLGGFQQKVSGSSTGPTPVQVYDDHDPWTEEKA